MTLKALSGKTGLTEGYLSKIENSKSTPPVSKFGRIAETLVIDLNCFILPDINERDKNPDIVIDREASHQGERFT